MIAVALSWIYQIDPEVLGWIYFIQVNVAMVGMVICVGRYNSLTRGLLALVAILAGPYVFAAICLLLFDIFRYVFYLLLEVFRYVFSYWRFCCIFLCFLFFLYVKNLRRLEVKND